MSALDPRLHAFRPDLADAGLQGRVEAERFVEGRPARIAAPVADLRRAPLPDAGLDTQLFHGDAVAVFEEREGFAWVQAQRDCYVGYISSQALAFDAPAPTHVACVPRTFAYSGPDLKLPMRAAHSLGAGFVIAGTEERRGTRYALLDTGEALVAAHLRPIHERSPDFVAVAETLERTPYLWGGASGFGIDCSGLVQLGLRMAGMPAPRDTDMQAARLGEAIEPGPGFSGLERGDLVFWKGHVAIMLDGHSIIHANGHSMTVAREKLAEAVGRIAPLYGEPTGFRRIRGQAGDQ